MPGYLDRYTLNRVISVCNNKGGVGKTTTSAHLGGLAARKLQTESDGRVLLLDLDEQGNLGEDLGYTGRGLSDHGLGLARAIMDGDEPFILRDVRPGLDVVPGGAEIERLAKWLQSQNTSLLPRSIEETPAASALAVLLTKLAENYQYVFIDCPPQNQMLQELALVASEYVLIPTKTDMSSRLGMGKMAAMFGRVRSTANPDIKLLGVLMFGVTSTAKAVRGEAVEWIDSAFATLPEDVCPKPVVLKSTIRHVEVPAFHVRERGQLAYELELGAEVGVSKTLASSVSNVAGDFANVTSEVLSRLFAFEARAMEGAE